MDMSGMAETAVTEESVRFTEAAERGDFTTVQRYLDNGVVLVDSPGQYGTPALAFAAANGRADVVALLLRRGARTDVEDPGGNTPLHLAAQSGHYACVELLLMAGAGRGTRNVAGLSAEDMAAPRVEELFDDCTARYEPLDAPHEGLLDALRRETAEVVPSGAPVCGDGLMSLLQAASMSADDAARVLTAGGGVTMDVDGGGAPPAGLEAVLGRLGAGEGLPSFAPTLGPGVDLREVVTVGSGDDLVRFLEENTPDLNAPLAFTGDTEDPLQTALHVAAAHNKFYAASILLDRGASASVRDAEGRLPQDLATQPFLVEYLQGKAAASASQ